MKNAIITGATKGIGRAVSLAFAKEGFNLAICSRNGKDLENIRQELLQINPQIKVVSCITDCSITQEVKDFAHAAVCELGFLDVLVNNVGTFIPESILDEKDGTLMEQMAINLMPAYELYRYFGVKMRDARTGHIFNICSVASIDPIFTAGSYSVTKYALFGLSKIMLNEMKQFNVKVTSILPGSTRTSSWEGTTLPEVNFVMPEDIASIMVNCLKMSPGAHLEEIHIKPVAGLV
ncbi:MAG: SDR family NAD(P)-dependent oxidoreductase [Sphingobacteriaceae bacterium]